MRCYFNGSVHGADQLAKHIGTVSFAIPDIGVVFRSRWAGNLLECQYAALLSLLQFIDSNDKVFKNKDIQILSDASVVVYHLTKETFIFNSVKPYYRMVQAYKGKFDFTVRWIPERENAAFLGLTDTPPLKPSVEINYSISSSKNAHSRSGGVLPM